MCIVVMHGYTIAHTNAHMTTSIKSIKHKYIINE